MKNIIAAIIIGLIINLASINPIFAKNQIPDTKAEKAKAKVTRIMQKDKKKIAVKLKDETSVKGILTTANADNFDVAEERTGKVVNISYSQVDKVSGGGGLSTATKIAIGAGVATAAFFALLYVAINSGTD